MAAVTSDHPLATAAGVEVLRGGGNAVDAAVTMAGVLAVVRPHMSGVGGDVFALIRTAGDGQVEALNGSGRAGRRATPRYFAERGFAFMPQDGLPSVTVPGAVRAWADALERHGTFTLERALEPAIHYAEHGFVVSDKLAHDLAEVQPFLSRDAALAEVFLPGEASPRPGTVLRQPDLAWTLRAIAREGADAVYGGEIARRIAALMQAQDGPLELEDLQAHTSTWTAPLETTYRGLRVLVCPPNSQGIALLEALNVAQRLDLAAMGHNSAAYIDALVQVKARVFADRDRWVADPAFAPAPLAEMLSAEHAGELARDVRHLETRAERLPAADDRRGAPAGGGDTVYLGVVDAEGNAVSWLQSIYGSFGSGRLVPGTGIVLHNRGALFSLHPGSANVVAPHKRPYHTLMPVLALRDGSLAWVCGTPGADGQPQTMLQVISNLLVFGMSPRQAVEAPRWRSHADGRLALETGILEDVRARLRAAGHDAIVEGNAAELGGAQVIRVEPDGALAAAADPRREAQAIVW